MSLEYFVITLGSGAGITHLIMYNNDFQIPFALGATTLLLIGLHIVLFKFIINPTWHKWVCNERNGLADEKFRDMLNDRLIANTLKELTGTIALAAWLGSTFRMTTVGEACWIAFILYVGAVLPNIHHYMWEGRRIPLMVFSEVYQCLRRLIAAIGIVIFADMFGETLNGTLECGLPFVGTSGTTTQIPILPVVIMIVLRFVLGMVWYGPLFGASVWLPAMQGWLGDPAFPSEESNSDIPKLLGAGIACGVLSSVVLLFVQVQTGTNETVLEAIHMASQLFVFFILPTISVDGWEGKSYTLSFVNYALYLIELCLLFVLGAMLG